ncbi:Peptidoglycan-binding LysM [Thermosinus carboxydivorans Nor1]|uniref:Peptidoglycan-binding LysM n=1 Tax=Thermosinus carboxydivorans Nor1 TaxID=401526 RepID=A1HMT4_9FIRM|nr:LysM domain-containing protein [Thermosinus carboxydivorans]EAX48741.1 Peptidoglycan-binding LysM [Thermosinus carboxydivorans Nor1]
MLKFYLKLFLFTMFVVIISWYGLSGAFAHTNAFLLSSSYQIITVNNGDTLWSIASNYVTDQDDIRDLIIAIKHTNNLDNGVVIHPGQQLKIPLKTKNLEIGIVVKK